MCICSREVKEGGSWKSGTYIFDMLFLPLPSQLLIEIWGKFCRLLVNLSGKKQKQGLLLISYEFHCLRNSREQKKIWTVIAIRYCALLTFCSNILRHYVDSFSFICHVRLNCFKKPIRGCRSIILACNNIIAIFKQKLLKMGRLFRRCRWKRQLWWKLLLVWGTIPTCLRISWILPGLVFYDVNLLTNTY